MRRPRAGWLLGCVAAGAVLAASPPAANDPQTIGGTRASRPAQPGPTPPAQPGPLEPEPIAAPGPGTTPPRPEDIAPPTPAGERRQAFINVLEPRNSMATTGPDRSVKARGRMQMVIPDDEVILYCNAVDYAGETLGTATLTGDLRIETGPIVKDAQGFSRIPNPENVLTGDWAYVFTKEKRLAVDGNVVLVHRPRDPAPPDADEMEQVRSEVTTVYCDVLHYWYRRGDRKAVLQPRLPNTRIKFEQPTRRGTAGQAKFYDFEAGQSETGDVLDLLGGVTAEDDQGQVFDVELCRLFVDLEEAHMHNVRQLVINLDEEAPATPLPAGPPPLVETPPGGANGQPETPPAPPPTPPTPPAG